MVNSIIKTLNLNKTQLKENFKATISSCELKILLAILIIKKVQRLLFSPMVFQLMILDRAVSVIAIFSQL